MNRELPEIGRQMASRFPLRQASTPKLSMEDRLLPDRTHVAMAADRISSLLRRQGIQFRLQAANRISALSP